MKASYLMVSLVGCFALGSSLAWSAHADAADPGSAQAATQDGQATIADATLKLEHAFADQFVRGSIDRSALAGPIQDVVQAMPEAARPKVQQHIDAILAAGQKLAAQLTPDERAKAAAAPTADSAGHLEQALVTGWGWPALAGWGGLGAFAFPGMYSYGWAPYGTSYYSSSSRYSGYGSGYGLGLGGWYW